MKRAFVIASLIFGSSISHAKLSNDCKRMLHSAANQVPFVKAVANDPAVSEENKEFFVSNLIDIEVSTFKVCAALSEDPLETLKEAQIYFQKISQQ